MRTRAVGLGLLASLMTLAGCGMNSRVPSDMQGRYASVHLLADELTVIVEETTIRVEGCDVNCGVATLPLTTVQYSPSEGTVSFSSEHCTGTIERSGSDISITATPVPGATGETVAIRNMTCDVISGLMSREG